MLISFRKYLIIVIVILVACHSNTGTRNVHEINTSQSGVKYAGRFDLQKKDGYELLTIKNPWQGAVNVSQSYFLVQEGVSIPFATDSTKIIRVPVKSIICMSTTHLSMISALHKEETIKGISGTDFVYDKSIQDLVANRRISDVGYEDNLNKEMVIQISPDLVMAYGIGSESTSYINKLKELGIKVLFNADYLETDPLGKAEWIKVFGALFDKEKEADSVFASLSEEYNNLKSYIYKNIKTKPTVFLGLPWKDTWFISPDNSYISRLISDAGGEYIWKDVKSEISMPFGIENVYIKALKADYWLNASSVNTRDEIVSMDNRLQELPSFKNGKIYNNNKRITKNGGNDYWESGSINPQVILKDIATILHPELFAGYDFFYYKKIE
jgi:iron complex transport system substrate-binding protein